MNDTLSDKLFPNVTIVAKEKKRWELKDKVIDFMQSFYETNQSVV